MDKANSNPVTIVDVYYTDKYGKTLKPKRGELSNETLTFGNATFHLSSELIDALKDEKSLPWGDRGTLCVRFQKKEGVLEHVFDDVPTVVLSNGIKVANFSSPHPFRFTDGSILQGCSADRVERLMLEAEEIETAGFRRVDIELTFKLTAEVRYELLRLGAMEDVEIILVPLPVMAAWKEYYSQPSARRYLKEVFDKIRCCRVADRMTKVIYADRFCK